MNFIGCRVSRRRRSRSTGTASIAEAIGPRSYIVRSHFRHLCLYKRGNCLLLTRRPRTGDRGVREFVAPDASSDGVVSPPVESIAVTL